MKIGISTACFYPLETEKALKKIVDKGIECTEVFFNAECELTDEFVRELVRVKDAGVTEIVSLHPTMSLAESFMLFSAYDRRTQQGLDQYRRYGEIAAMLGAKYIIMHGGKDNGILNCEQYCERFLKIAECVREGGGILLQENAAKFRAGELRFLSEMKKHLGKSAEFCLDTKQCIRRGYTPFDAIEEIGENIKHLHISDSTPCDDCLLPKRGNFDFAGMFERLSALGYDGNAVIEVYSKAYESFDEIFESLQNLKENLSL